MTSEDIYDKISNIKLSFNNNPIIDTAYEIVEINRDYPRRIFRKIDKPNQCHIEFQISRGDADDEIELYIDNFDCEYTGKQKRQGLIMLRALVNYINDKADEQHITNRTIKLTSLPRYKLLNYYLSIGFKFEDNDDIDAFELNDMDSILNNSWRDGPPMSAKFDDILTASKPKKSRKSKAGANTRKSRRRRIDF